jgi:methionyl-tRNA formyltransferase
MNLLEVLEKYNPDLCVVNGWYKLINDKVLAFPSHGFIAVHNSLLPKYRGGAPLVWALMNGDEKVGSSIFYLSEGMDDGDIVSQVELKVNPNNYIRDVANNLQVLVLEEFEKIWPKILDNSQVRKPQNHAEASYCAQLTSKDGKIDWRKPAIHIYNQIRAQSLPYPCAYARLGETTIPIISAEPFENKLHGFPGQVALILDDGVVVACGNNTGIKIKEVLKNNISEKASFVLNSISLRLD